MNQMSYYYYLFLCLFVAMQGAFDSITAQTSIFSNEVGCKASIVEDLIQCQSSKSNFQFEFRLSEDILGGSMFTFLSSSIVGPGDVSSLHFEMEIIGLTTSGDKIHPVFYLDGTHFAERLSTGTLKASLRTKNLSIAFNERVISVIIKTKSNAKQGVLLMKFTESSPINSQLETISSQALLCPLNSVNIAMDISSSMSIGERDELNINVLDIIEKLIESKTKVISLTRFNSFLTITDDAAIAVPDRLKFWEKELGKHYDQFIGNSPNSSFTNWEQVFDLTIATKPDLLILMTDGFPNWYESKSHSLAEDHDRLKKKSNNVWKSGTQVWIALMDIELDGGHELLYSLSNSNSNSLPDAINLISSISTNNFIFDRWIDRLTCKNDLPDQMLLQIRPTPTTGEIEIILNETLSKGKIKIFNINGQLMHAREINYPATILRFSLQNILGSGQYFVLLVSEGHVFTGKFTIVD